MINNEARKPTAKSEGLLKMFLENPIYTTNSISNALNLMNQDGDLLTNIRILNKTLVFSLKQVD